MNSRLTLSIALVLASSASAQTQPSTRPATQPATTQPAGAAHNAYQNGEHQFRLKYPNAWEWRDNTAGAAAFFAGPLHEDGTRPVVQVTVLNAPERKPDEMDAKPLTLDKVSEQMVATLQRSIQDADVDKIEDAKLGGTDAKCITYTGTFHEDTYKFIQTVCLNERRIYVVTYANLETHSDDFVSLAKAILESFEFVK